MRHGAAGRRSRNRGNGGGNNGNIRRGGMNRNHVFDSNGPDVRIRGTAHQIQEKYAVLAKDAIASGDYVLSESYHQHAEHYQRLINGWMEELDRAEAGIEEHDMQQDETESRRRSNPRPEQRNQQPADDLGLPSSILGEPAKAKQEELADA